VNSEAQPVDQ